MEKESKEFESNGWIVITDQGIPQVSIEDKIVYWGGTGMFIPVFEERQEAGDWATKIKKRLRFSWYKTIQTKFIYFGEIKYLRGEV